MDQVAFRAWLRAGVDRGLVPIAAGLGRLGVRPNHVTVAGTAVNGVVAGLIVFDRPVLAGALWLGAGTLDVLDGTLARVRDAGTPFGAFLDSTLDRVSESLVLSAIAYRFALDGHPVDAGVTAAALAGSLLVSYTRARAESLGVPGTRGLATRAERVLVLAAGLLFDVLRHAIYLLALATVYTTTQRILATRRALTPAGNRVRGER